MDQCLESLVFLRVDSEGKRLMTQVICFHQRLLVVRKPKGAWDEDTQELVAKSCMLCCLIDRQNGWSPARGPKAEVGVGFPYYSSAESLLCSFHFHMGLSQLHNYIQLAVSQLSMTHCWAQSGPQFLDIVEVLNNTFQSRLQII